MQRLHKAFLQRNRKALIGNNEDGNNNSNNINNNIVIWGLVFLLSFCTAHSHDTRMDGLENLVDKTCWCRADPGLIQVLFRGAEGSSACTCSKLPNWSSCGSSGESRVSITTATEQENVENYSIGERTENDTPKSDRLFRDAPLRFDEFKTRAINPKGKSTINQAGSIMHRVEPGGTEYNYASASKGAKVLAFNKEAKGASNILGKDMDKYLLNPCLAEGKFVVVELSEETLVDTVDLANLEHHSSNFKDFQMLGSLVYPTETWMQLGNFTAKNVKQSQRFTLHGPKWVRYLKLSFLSHYGSEFYCTLSVVQVYGVDAVERMLEDLISDQDKLFGSENLTNGQERVSSRVTHSQTNGSHQNLAAEVDSQSMSEDWMTTNEASKSDKSDEVGDLRPQLVGRMPVDSVLKVLMQKVRSLDLNLSVLERYLEELNSRYGNILKDFEKEIVKRHMLLEKMRSDIVTLLNGKEAIFKDFTDINSWKSLVSLHIDNLKRENALLRSEVERISENQMHMENKGIIVFLVISICSLLAIVKLFLDIAVSVCGKKLESRIFCWTEFSWIFFVLISSAIGIILLL